MSCHIAYLCLFIICVIGIVYNSVTTTAAPTPQPFMNEEDSNKTYSYTQHAQKIFFERHGFFYT